MVKMHKFLKRTGWLLLWWSSVLLMQIPIYLWIQYRKNPLDDLGVSIKMFYPHNAATSSTPWIYVYCEYSRTHIKPDIVWGGMPYPSLQFEDVDQDGIKDIIFGNGQVKQIVAFKPADGEKTPQFIVLRDDMK